jgi:hypothetical protein
MSGASYSIKGLLSNVQKCVLPFLLISFNHRMPNAQTADHTFCMHSVMSNFLIRPLVCQKKLREGMHIKCGSLLSSQHHCLSLNVA